jgi:hypothetical protein
MRTQRLIAYAFAAGLVSLMAGSAMADDERGNPNALLKGTYRHIASGSGASVPTTSSSELGFNPWPDLTARGGGSAGDHTYFTGVITYDGKGYATETIQGIIIFTGRFGPGSFPLLTFEENCDWTYDVKRDGSFTREGTCRGTTTGGQFADSPYTLSGLKWVGQIGIGGAVLISYRVDPTMETTLSNGFFTKTIGANQGTEVRIRTQ